MENIRNFLNKDTLRKLEHLSGRRFARLTVLYNPVPSTPMKGAVTIDTALKGAEAWQAYRNMQAMKEYEEADGSTWDEASINYLRSLEKKAYKYPDLRWGGTWEDHAMKPKNMKEAENLVRGIVACCDTSEDEVMALETYLGITMHEEWSKNPNLLLNEVGEAHWLFEDFTPQQRIAIAQRACHWQITIKAIES